MFYFSKILIFLVVRRVKGQKVAQNDKNSVLCTLYLWNHTSCGLDLWCKCVKGQYLQVLFTFFPNFNFLVQWWGKRAKNGLKWQFLLLSCCKKKCLIPYIRSCSSYDFGFWYKCVKWWYLQQYFSDFPGFSKFINKCQEEILTCAPPSSHVCDFIFYFYIFIFHVLLEFGVFYFFIFYAFLFLN